jgi:hypothetical protein
MTLRITPIHHRLEMYVFIFLTSKLHCLMLKPTQAHGGCEANVFFETQTKRHIVERRATSLGHRRGKQRQRDRRDGVNVM